MFRVVRPEKHPFHQIFNKTRTISRDFPRANSIDELFLPCHLEFSRRLPLEGQTESVFRRIEPPRFELQEILEKALGGLRHKLQGSRSNLAEAERYRKQQLLLERELSRVRVLLAHNSKVRSLERLRQTFGYLLVIVYRKSIN